MAADEDIGRDTAISSKIDIQGTPGNLVVHTPSGFTIQITYAIVWDAGHTALLILSDGSTERDNNI